MLETYSRVKESSDEKLDLVLAYVLGDVTETERSAFEGRLAAGDTELVFAYEQALESFSGLPRALTSAVPPPFVKERVLARVQDDEALEMIFFEEVAVEQEQARLPLLTRILSQVPGYGSFSIASLLPSKSTARRSIGFAFLVVGGLFVSAYAVDRVASIMTLARGNHDQFVDHVRSYRAKQSESAGVGAQTARPVDKHELSMEAPSASVTPIKPVLTIAPSSAAAVTGAKAIQPPQIHRGSERLQTNFSSVDAQMYFVASPITLRYELKPFEAGASAFARVSWDVNHSDAFFTVSGLAPSQPGTHYVLWYLNDDGTKKRLLTFEAVSEATQFFFLDEAPAPQNNGVLLTLEATNHSHSAPILKATNVIRKQH